MAVTKEQIADLISQDLIDVKLRHIGLTIFEYLVSQPYSSLQHISYGSIKILLDGKFTDAEVLQAVQYLCGDRASVLQTRFEFIDGDDIIPVDNQEVIEAKKHGSFIHPRSGEEIQCFEEYIAIYFQPSDLIKDLSAQ